MSVPFLFRAWVSIGAVAAIGACSTARSAETDAQEQPVPVRVAPAEEVTRPVIAAASGVVQAHTAVDVAFQVPGKVVAVGPDEGAAVRVGELLAQIDSTDYRLGVEQAVAQAEHATSERDRYRPLLAAGSISPSDFDRIESGARQAAAAADLARKHLADTRLVAPMTGIVARRGIERGATASPGQPVFTLMDVDPVRVRVGIPESEIGGIRVGQRAQVQLPALAGQAFAGRVTLVGIAAEPTTRTYAVEISVPNHDHRLRVGMVAEARVELERQRRVITVPIAAVVRDADDVSLLYVLDQKAQRAHARRVEIGAAHDDAIEVAHGLAAGELVIIAGQQRLREGSRVVPASHLRQSSEPAGGAR
jgi:membrane fusion protein (multidrug efflux system)